MSDYKAIPSFTALRAFHAVGNEKGIRKAATALSVDHAVITRHVRNLEAWLGVDLLDRTDPSAFLTPAGASFHSRISAAIHEMQSAVADIVNSADDGCIFVWCVPGLALHWLAPRLSDFHRKNPDIQIELRPSDFPPNLSGGEADIDIRYVWNWSAAPSAKLRALVLARPEVYPVISPSLAQRHADIDVSSDAWQSRLLHEDDQMEWREWLRQQGVDYHPGASGIRLWQAHLCLDAARRGHGIALANDLLAMEDLLTGRLTKLAFGSGKSARVELGAYSLFTDAKHWGKPSIARFRRWIYLQINRSAEGALPRQA